VRTGKYRDDVVRACGIRPDAVIDSIADLPALLSGRLGPRPGAPPRPSADGAGARTP
jgi:hypothetical protein